MVASSKRLPEFHADELLGSLTEQREQRLSSIGKMTATLAHQIRTPLASAILYAEQLKQRDDMPNSPAAQVFERLNEISHLIDDMLCYAGGARCGTERFSVGQLFKDIVDVSWECVGEGSLSIALLRDDLVVAGNRTAIKGALLNLIENAFQACHGSGRVELGAEVIDDRVCLTVSDNGHGIQAEIKDRLFEPFFTTRPRGTGLGLAVVRAVAEAHNGEVIVDSSPKGSTFALCLGSQGGVI